MRRIALVNQKGGVGKTTTAVNLSAAIARLDRRVLLIDLDPQSNATVSLGVPPDQQKNNTSYGLLNGAPFQPIELSPNFHLVPSNIELAGAEMELTSVIGREIVLRDALSGVTGYDFMILDCSPSLGLLSVNALTTAKEVMVPLQCEFLALHGISLLMRTIDLVRKRLNTELSITGVIPCMYDVSRGLARDVVVEIEKHFGNKVFKSKIRSNVRLAEAPSHGKSIFDYAPDSYGAEDYLALAREIVGIELIPRPAESLPVVERFELSEPPPELIVPPPAEPMMSVDAGEPVPYAVTGEFLSSVAVAEPPVRVNAGEPGSYVVTPEPLASVEVAESVVSIAPAVVAEPPVGVEAGEPVPFAATPEPLASVEVAEPVVSIAPAVVTEPPVAVEAPVVEEPAPIAEPTPVIDAAPLPDPIPAISPPEPAARVDPAPATAPSPEETAAADLVSDGVVEYIELIPLEIEELPCIEPETTA